MDSLTFMFQLFETQSPEEMLALCISVDVATTDMLKLSFLYVQTLHLFTFW